MTTQPNRRNGPGKVVAEATVTRIKAGVFRAYGMMARARKRPYEYVFVLSHMRAGSSLLAMVLGNNPEICGYGETFVTYRSAADLDLLAGNNLYRLQRYRLPGNERYMMDKLVFDRLMAPEVLPDLAEQGSKFIFLVRDAEGAMRSIMPLAGGEETFAAAAYIQRLDMLEKYGAALAGHARPCLLSYHDLIDRTESTLRALTTFLELSTPLQEQYEVLPPLERSSAAHFAKLHLGRIDRSGSAAPAVTFEAHNLAVAEGAFARCWQSLARFSQVVGDGG